MIKIEELCSKVSKKVGREIENGVGMVGIYKKKKKNHTSSGIPGVI